MPLPPLPKPGDTVSWRRIGKVLSQVLHNKRQVRWEDGSCSHTSNPDVLAFPADQRFECVVTFRYDEHLRLNNSPHLKEVRPLPPLPPISKEESQALWGRIMTGDKISHDEIN